MAQITVEYLPKGGKLETFKFNDVDIDQTTLFVLKEKLTMETNLSIVRQRILLKLHDSFHQSPLLDDRKSLKQLNLSPIHCNNLILKDIGPQMAWNTVFYLEYLGPLLIHQVALLFWSKLTTRQLLGYVAISLHFLKREFETAFIHRFSHSTMPLSNLAKNCLHYWLICGFLISFELYFRPSTNSTFATWTVFLLFLLMEVGNFISHVILRNLRPLGTHKRSIPHGFLFDYVSCPNYFFESMAWLCFAMITRCYSAWLFWILGTGQMFLWAKKKHSSYKKEFVDYPKSRKVMFPFLI
jgi:very-long-chain enoyl-CoA reductase